MAEAMVSLTGTPREIGATWGRVNGDAIGRECAAFMRTAAERGLDRDELLRRAEAGARVMATAAPHWREEADACAAAAGIDPDEHLAFHVGRYRDLFFVADECTSYAASGAATAGGVTVFHKSRDNTARPQVAYVKRPRVPGVLAHLTLSDTTDLGCMMMVNEAGLAGSADMGAPEPRPRGRGLMNPWGLRHIAERASTCAEALEIVREWNDRGWYAGGGRATNWLFADATGELLRVVNSHDALEVERARDGILLNCERVGLREFLTERIGALDDAAFMAAARLPGVSFDSTISALSVAVDPSAPGHTIAWVCVGRPGRLPFVPLGIGVESVPVALLDGSLSRPPTEGGPPADQIAALEADFRVRAAAIDPADRAALEALTAGCVRDARAALAAPERAT